MSWNVFFSLSLFIYSDLTLRSNPVRNKQTNEKWTPSPPPRNNTKRGGGGYPTELNWYQYTWSICCKLSLYKGLSPIISLMVLITSWVIAFTSSVVSYSSWTTFSVSPINNPSLISKYKEILCFYVWSSWSRNAGPYLLYF